MRSSNEKCKPQIPCVPKEDLDPQRILHLNIQDVASALVKVLKICGIFQLKAEKSRNLIIEAFKYYDEVQYQIDLVPKKQLRKQDFVLELSSKCEMTLAEAQLTYSIVKRAFKAFYYGTNKFSLHNSKMDEQLIHCQECLWVHAAKRTAQIFAEYEGMFHSTQKKYEELIKRVYICLYDRLISRAAQLTLPVCCNKCNSRKSATLTKTISKTASELIQTCVHYKPREYPDCSKCKCPKLICDCGINLSGFQSQECSQGPFICRWVRADDDEIPIDPCLKKVADQLNAVSCEKLNEISSEIETETVCGEDEDVCAEDYPDYLESFEEYELSEIPSYTSYICNPPEPDTNIVMLPDKMLFILCKNEKPILPIEPCKCENYLNTPPDSSTELTLEEEENYEVFNSAAHSIPCKAQGILKNDKTWEIAKSDCIVKGKPLKSKQKKKSVCSKVKSPQKTSVKTKVTENPHKSQKTNIKILQKCKPYKFPYSVYGADDIC